MWEVAGETTPKMTDFRIGTLVTVSPVDAPRVVMTFVVTYAEPGVVRLWNNGSGVLEMRPRLVEQIDGTWRNAHGLRYTVTPSLPPQEAASR